MRPKYYEGNPKSCDSVPPLVAGTESSMERLVLATILRRKK